MLAHPCRREVPALRSATEGKAESPILTVTALGVIKSRQAVSADGKLGPLARYGAMGGARARGLLHRGKQTGDCAEAPNHNLSLIYRVSPKGCTPVDLIASGVPQRRLASGGRHYARVESSRSSPIAEPRTGHSPSTGKGQ